MGQLIDVGRLGFHLQAQSEAYRVQGSSSGGGGDQPCIPGETCPGRITGHNPLVLFGVGALLLIVGLIIGYMLGKKAARSLPNR